MLSVDITIAFPRQLEEYALFTDDFTYEPMQVNNYVRVAFWVKIETGYVPCIQVENDFIEVDLTNYYGEFQSVVSKEEVDKNRHYQNVKIFE